MDQNGVQVARSAFSFAEVIFYQEDGDLIKAEGLAREAIRIRFQLLDSGIGGYYMLLAKILLKQKNFGDETRDSYERSLADFIRNEGPDGVNTAAGNTEFGRFYYQFAIEQSIVHTKRTQLLLANSYLDEAVRIEIKIHSQTHPNRVAAASLLSIVLNELSRI
jgi:hypothetical protein